MEKVRQYLRSTNTTLLWVSCLAMICGGLYYLFFRGYGNSLASHWVAFDHFRNGLSDPTAGALPSLLHMLALGCLAAVLLGAKRGARLIIALLLMTLLAEKLVGVFDWADVLYAAIGSFLAIVLAARAQSNEDSTSWLGRRPTAVASAALVACSGLFIGATAPCVGCDESYGGERPVYLSYANLRSAVSVEGPRELSNTGRVYLYQDYIFLNKRNQGIHVLDNSDPENPENVLFISVPGNTELSIRDNYLYADSYVDLVTLDLNDPANIQVANRQTDVFPWDEYQNVPDTVYFYSNDLDQTKGVVIGYAR